MDRGFGMQPFPRGGGVYFADHLGRGGGWPDSLSWVIFSLLLALLLLAIVSLALAAYHRSQDPRPFVKWLPPGGPPGMFPGGRALGVLGVRYARGEISREDYLQARADLGGAAEEAEEAPTDVIPRESPAPRRRTRKPQD